MIEDNIRESEDSVINVLIVLSNFPSDLPFTNKDIYLDRNKALDIEIKKFLKDNNVILEGEYYLYLKVNDEIIKELDKKQTSFKLGLKSNNEILISKIKLNGKRRFVNINEDLSFNKDSVLDVNKKRTKKRRNIHNNKKFQSEFYNTYSIKSEKRLINNIVKNEEKSLKKKNKIIIIIIVIMALLFIGVGLYFVLKFIKDNKKKILELESDNPNIKVYKEEKFATKINYKIDYVLRYTSEKSMKIEMKSDEVDENEGTKAMNKSSDFIFIIREKHIENDDVQLTKKLWFTGYISILNMIVNNGTNETLILYDQNLNLHFSNNNLSVLNEKTFNQVDEEGKMCFAKIDFYENGEVKNIYYPDGLSTSNKDNIKEIIELIIPKISANLFINNITEFLNTPDLMILNNLRNLNENNKKENFKKIRYKVALNNNKSNKNRKLSNDSINEAMNNDTDYMYIEEYLSEPLTPSSKLDLREINNITDGYNDSGNQNLTRFSQQSVESDLVKLEGSSKKSSVYTTIDENGLIQSIQLIEEAEMTNEHNSDFDEQEINNQIYNEDNQIPLETMEEISLNDTPDIKFNISKLGIKTINQINLTEYLFNENLTQNLYNYFDNFDYKLENQQNLTYLRMLEIKDEFIKSNNLIELSPENENKDSNDINLEKRRKLENIKSYYGIKKLIHKRELFNHNLIGLILKGDIYSEIDPSLGTTNVYLISQFGNYNQRYGFKEFRTNLHIIIERTNQMTYNLIKELSELNNNIDKRNKKYNKIILNYENEIIKLFEKYYDYSKLFDNDLENLYQQISSFSSDTFNELITLINNAYSKYLNILKEVKEDKYDVFNTIRLAIRNDYLDYIKYMNNLLLNFCNDTLLFLDNIQEEMIKIDDFTIDFFYDIIDVVDNGKMILKEFVSKIFSSVEKGIIILKKNINNNAEKNIGDFLYITDFLSININKNKLLKKSFEEDVRKELSFKLDEFRNIVNFIINLLIYNINNDYSKEITDNNGIKFFTDKLVYNNSDIIQNEENKFINVSEQKIENLHLYELYNSNLEVINNITNKTIMESIDDSYNNILLQSMKIEPEYLNKNSDIIEKKHELFNITSSIINEVNQKNIEINKYIENYIKEYYENNFYNLYYNILNFKKYFMDEEMNNLYIEFNNLINIAIKIKLKNIFYKNYNLVKQALDEENSLFDEYCDIFWFKDLYMGSSFKDKFLSYINITQEFYTSILRDLPEIAANYFTKIKTEIDNKVKNEINSLNKYYFDDKLYKQYFINFENIKNGILNTSFDQTQFSIKKSLIKSEPSNIIRNEINNISENLIDSAFGYFNKTVKRATKGVMNTKFDFVFRYYIFFGVGKNKYRNIEHKNYTNELESNLTSINNYMLSETNKIITKYIAKFDKYLSNYIKITQNLYSNLYKDIDSKINNLDNIKYLTNNYKLLFSDILSNNSNYKLLENLYNNSLTNISLYFTNIENNINLIREDYFKLHYLKDHNKFLELPEEIIIKINQFMNELNIALKSIKNNINIAYRNKITNAIKSTNQFIENFHENNFKYIEQNINKNKMLYSLFSSRYNYINTLFGNCKTIYKSLIKDIYKESEQNSYLKINNNDFILNDGNYNENIALILNNYSNFTLYFQDIIDTNFSNQSDKNIELNYSNYNFIVSKLRRGLYFTKSLIKNIKDTFNNLQYDIILNTSIINIYDDIVNEKDILNLYNNSIYKLNNINENSMNKIKKEYIDNFYKMLFEGIKKYNNYSNDILPFIYDFINIIKFDNNNFLKNITYENNQTINYLYTLLDEFNSTLYEQLIDNDNIYYNLSFEFNELYNEYDNNIENIFNNYENKIKALRSNHTLHNCLRNYLKILQDEKRNYFKETINNKTKSYNMELLNITIDLGEYIESNMKKEFEEEEFKNEYHYINIYEYSDIFINNINSIILSLKNKVQSKLKDIYNMYSKALINERNKIPQINTNDSLDSRNIIQDFDVKNKNKLNNVIEKIKSKIISSYFDENYLINYFRKYYKLQDYQIDIDELSFNFKKFEEEIESLRNKEDFDYKNYLSILLIESFNNSYYNLSNHYLKQQIVNNIDISINYKIGVLIDYIIEKIKKEYNYYISLLNNTDDLGKTSKIAVINLYLDLYNNLNETINEFIENIFDLNLPLLYQDIKNSFRNNFLNYYYKEENEYKNKIFNLNTCFKEIILKDSFNNSLNKLSDTIINKVINEEIKETINNLVNTKIKSLKEFINDTRKNISKILDNKSEKSINENMTIINNLIIEYNEIIKGQNKKYIFEPNDNLTNLSDDFFINILGPPLIIIKEKYNAIETDLLNQIIELINAFPDFYTIIKNNINITDKFEILGDIFIEIKNNLIAYGDELNEDFDSLFNKIIHFAYINGLDIYDKSCENSFCAVHSDPNEIIENRNLNEKQEIKFNNYSNINKTELSLKSNKNIGFNRKLEYNHNMGALSVDDVMLYLFEIEKVLYNFNGTYLGEKFIQMNETMYSYISIIGDILLEKLKNSIDKTSANFLTILTENSYKIFEQNMYKQYYEIEAFIQERCNFTKINVNYFIEQLNNTSVWVKLNFDLIYNRVLR